MSNNNWIVKEITKIMRSFAKKSSFDKGKNIYKKSSLLHFDIKKCQIEVALEIASEYYELTIDFSPMNIDLDDLDQRDILMEFYGNTISLENIQNPKQIYNFLEIFKNPHASCSCQQEKCPHFYVALMYFIEYIKNDYFLIPIINGITEEDFISYIFKTPKTKLLNSSLQIQDNNNDDINSKLIDADIIDIQNYYGYELKTGYIPELSNYLHSKRIYRLFGHKFYQYWDLLSEKIQFNIDHNNKN